MGMKLFAFQPRGLRALSFFVVAASEEEARGFVDARIASDPDITEFDCAGWGTEYYEVTVAEPGQVVVNYND